MMASKIVIGSRQFSLTTGESIDVTLFLPEMNGDDYKCEYKIRGSNLNIDGYSFGIDSIQSIYLALKNISTDLYASELWSSGNLHWTGGFNPGDLGLPMTDAIESMVAEAAANSGSAV